MFLIETIPERLIIRPARPEDARAIHAIRISPEVLPNIASLPTEPLSRTVSSLQRPFGATHTFVAEWIGDPPDSTGLRPVHPGQPQVVGVAMLYLPLVGPRRHTAGFGIMVRGDYHGRGVGSKLIAAILDLADNHLRIERVELTVYTANPRAIRLYERHGFVPEVTLRGETNRAGKHADALAMARMRPKSKPSPPGQPAE